MTLAMTDVQWWQWLPGWLALVPLLIIGYRFFSGKHVARYWLMIVWGNIKRYIWRLNSALPDRSWAAQGRVRFGKYQDVEVSGGGGQPYVERLGQSYLYVETSAKRGHIGFAPDVYPAVRMLLSEHTNEPAVMLFGLAGSPAADSRSVALIFAVPEERSNALQVGVASGLPGDDGVILRRADDILAMMSSDYKEMTVWMYENKYRGDERSIAAKATFHIGNFAATPEWHKFAATKMPKPRDEVAELNRIEVRTACRISPSGEKIEHGFELIRGGALDYIAMPFRRYTPLGEMALPETNGQRTAVGLRWVTDAVQVEGCFVTVAVELAAGVMRTHIEVIDIAGKAQFCLVGSRARLPLTELTDDWLYGSWVSLMIDQNRGE